MSMARPFLADPDFVPKAAAGRAAEIAPCIACNQACLDHTFSGRVATCLVNPRAAHETELVLAPTARPARGSPWWAPGPAGLAAALAAAERGHAVDAVRARRPARRAAQPGPRRPGQGGVPRPRRRGSGRWSRCAASTCGSAPRPTPEDLAGFDAVVVATGVRPRDPMIPGQDLPHVATYADILTGRVVAGPRVAVVGAGGIGFDVAEFLVTGESPTLDPEAWRAEWGVGDPAETPGGLAPEGPRPPPPLREVTLLQRRPEDAGQAARAGPPAGSTAPRSRCGACGCWAAWPTSGSTPRASGSGSARRTRPS